MNPTCRARRGRAWRRAGLALGGALAALAVAEAVLRASGLGWRAHPTIRAPDGRHLANLAEIARFVAGTDHERGASLTMMLPDLDVRGWYDRPQWDYFDSNGCVTYRTNSLGFRGSEFPVQRPTGELRLLCIGDSFTFGLGVQADDAWPAQLEARLRKHVRGAVRVINGGYAAGFHPPTYAPWVASHSQRLDLDALVVGICLNDLDPEIPMYLPLAPPIHPPFDGEVRVLSVACDALNGWIDRRAQVPPPVRARRYLKLHPAEWLAFREGLLSIRDSCAGDGVRLLVVVFPMLSQLARGYPFVEFHRSVDDFCRESGIDCLDTLPRFVGREERELWVHPTDQHMNDVGHALLAEMIDAHFAAHPLLPRAR